MIDCILPAIKEHMESSEFSDIQDNDHEEHFKDSLIKVFADIGLYGITLGKTQGGLGLSYIAYIQILELLASFDASYALLVAATNTLLIEPLDSLSQNKELMNLILHGEVYGTGAVVFDNTAYIIDPNSFHKKYISIYSNDSVYIFQDSHCTKLAKPLHNQLGLRSLPLKELSLSDYTSLPGIEVQKYDTAKISMNSKLALSGIFLGMCKKVYKICKEYTSERCVCNSLLIDYPINTLKLSEMATQMYIIEQVLYNACMKTERNSICIADATMIQAIASKATKTLVDTGIQLLGAYGLSCEYDLERVYRDSRMLDLLYPQQKYDQTVIIEKPINIGGQ